MIRDRIAVEGVEMNSSVQPEFAFTSEQDAAGKLLQAARAAGIKLYPLPYSRY
jgi:hypothetical protein